MEVRHADPGDWPAIRELLSMGGLPLDGAANAFRSGVVAVDRDLVVGGAAIEPFLRSALLRSVAVAPDLRGAGVGTALVKSAEDLARERGATTVFLLTETAQSWFGRLGYEVVDRSAIPVDVAGSVEFTTACSSTAVAMRRSLT